MSQDIKTVRVKAEPEWESAGARVSPYTEPGDVSADAQAGKCEVKEERDSSNIEDKLEDAVYIKYEVEESGYLEPVKQEADSTECEVEEWANERDVPCSSRVVKEELEVGPDELHRPKPLLATHGSTQQGDQNEQAVETILPGSSALPLTLQTNPAGEKLYKCPHCSYATDFQNNIRNHVRIHYKCAFCDFRARSEIGLLKHQKYCSHAGDGKTDLKVQKTIHSSEKSYKCTYCSYASESQTDLKDHEMTHGDKPYKCIFCSFATAHKEYLTTHEETHTGDKPYKCTFCSFATVHNEYLITHEWTHTGFKPYKCSFCSFATSHKTSLYVHIRSHTGDKPFKCAFCSFASASNNGLLYHKRSVHTGEKPYKCPNCSYAATRKGHLKHHMLKHTGEKQFKCTHCSYAAVHKRYLKVHERKHTV